jgi:fructose-bisphosphate aldolase class I
MQDALRETALALVAPGKGILAADESGGTIGRRLAAVGVESTEDTRRAYRELLLATPGIEQYLSGVILFDETIRQQTSDGTPFPELLAAKGIVPGIKVDRGAHPLALASGEQVTEGLDGLRERLEEYRGLGARFAKWRAVYTVGDGLPSEHAVWANAHALARYAALCQEAGIVPIVEPEVLMDGTHTIEASYRATARAQHALFTELRDQRVELEGILLKPNMVVSGYAGSNQAGVEEVAHETIRCLRHHVPAAVPGIVFLSGGQNDLAATAHLDAMARLGPHPWQLTFSYARALQNVAMELWHGDPANVDPARHAFLHRARMNGLARSGSYEPRLEDSA